MSNPIHDPAKPGADPSMDDILASIRRILSEDEPTSAATPGESTEPPAVHTAPGKEEGVLMLDSSMIVAGDKAEAAPSSPPAEIPPNALPSVHESSAMPAPEAVAPLPAGPAAREMGLLGAESAAAAASSVDALVRTLSAERGTQVSRNGPTIEDLVREELRPILKAWLDTHLPPLVERLVRAEIERVSGRVS